VTFPFPRCPFSIFHFPLPKFSCATWGTICQRTSSTSPIPETRREVHCRWRLRPHDICNDCIRWTTASQLVWQLVRKKLRRRHVQDVPKLLTGGRRGLKWSGSLTSDPDRDPTFDLTRPLFNSILGLERAHVMDFYPRQEEMIGRL